MQLIDTHTHLYLPEFDTDRDETVKRAVGNGIIKMLMPNIDVDSVDRMLSVRDRYLDICYPMMGLHPTSVKDDYREQLDRLEQLHYEHEFIAVGEIGIDLYWDKTYVNEQVTAFRRQVAYAVDNELPVVVHSRESFREVFAVLDEFRGRGLKGVLHAFTGGAEELEKAKELGLMLGIGGIVTFKNSGLDKVLKEADPDSIILETDSPYLAPVPFRGKRNESSYVPLINKKIADIFGMSEEKTADLTYYNSSVLFSRINNN
ncbi:MAG TPA: TatD family hydrolase [Bacteroidales bacterium]|nr:TatD family hydrolase [Bacteroidales bacterium]